MRLSNKAEIFFKYIIEYVLSVLENQKLLAHCFQSPLKKKSIFEIIIFTKRFVFDFYVVANCYIIYTVHTCFL